MEESQLTIGADQVHGLLGRHMMADGLDVVVDFERSQGSRLYDAKSDRFFVDFFSFYATNPVGFNHPRMVHREVVEELGRAAIHKPSNSDVYSREMAEFVNTFSRLAKPDFMRYMFFIDGGALAVENALKAAFDWKARKNLAADLGKTGGGRVIHFREAFHGRSGYTLSLTNTADSRKTQYFPKFDWPRVVNPKCRFPLQGDNLNQVVEMEEQALSQMRAALEEFDDIACLILEPIQGEGGDNHFRPEFHRQLRRLCDEHELLLIHDEVQTGFGATGRMWAFEHYVRPDILAFGKKSQVCGILVSERIDEVAENVFHVSSRLNSTWGGNLVDMVRSRFHLEIYEEERLLEHSRRMGDILFRELGQLVEEFPEQISNQRGLGLFCAFDLPNADVRDRFQQKLFRMGLIILASGERSLRFRSALNITEEELFEGLQIIRETASAEQ